MDEEKRNQMAINLADWQHDDLPAKIPELNEMLNTDCMYNKLG